MKKIFTLILMFSFFTVRVFSEGNNVTLSEIDNYNNWGKKAIVIENGYINIVIMPEIGGRVMHYGFKDDQYMAVNESVMSKTYDPDINSNGPWSSWGYGGYKNWPSPQDWGWPPPPHLCWGPYQYTVEVNSPDSVSIYLESEVETTLTPGMKQARRIVVYKNTTRVKVEQYLTNTSTSVKENGVWDITQAIVQHDKDADYKNFSLYFPASKAKTVKGWGSNFSITEIGTELQKFQYSKVEGKYNIYLSEGWCSFVDELDNQTYVKIFNLYEDKTYPDGNSNFELYSSGGNNYIEIEVMGPVENISQDETIRFDEDWYAANIPGETRFSNKCGTVRQNLNFDSGTSNITGDFGIFNTGSYRLSFINETGSEIGTTEFKPVTAAQRLTLNESITCPEGTKKIGLNIFNSNQVLIGILDYCSTNTSNSEELKKIDFSIYPNVCSQGDIITINLNNSNLNNYKINLISINGKKVELMKDNNEAQGKYSIITPALPSGVYILQLLSEDLILQKKLIIK